MWSKAITQVKEFVAENCKSFLNCGCGIALDYEEFKDSGIEYQGVDITAKFVEAAQKRGVPAQQGSILDLPFGDNCFDAVYCKDVLMHLLVDDWKKALNEMYRVSRKYVITLEPAWGADTIYSLREKYMGEPITKGESNLLMFFYNIYGIVDIMTWAAGKGLKVQKWSERSSYNGALGMWQLTIFTKE